MRNRKANRDSLEIVYEDKWIIVADKPSGLLTMSTGKEGEVTAYSLLYDYLDGHIFIVHRLDRDTSGLVLFAKDMETKSILQETWNYSVHTRGYTAVLEGHIDDEEGWIETWIYESPKSMKVHCYGLRPGDTPEKPPRKDWQFAATSCRTTKHVEIEGRPYTMVRFELETGRKNQIRVHSQWIGHPIAGDRKYGAETDPFKRLALHADTLSFIHPITGKEMTFNSRLPKVLGKL